MSSPSGSDPSRAQSVDPTTAQTLAFSVGDAAASSRVEKTTLEALNSLPGYRIEQKLGQGGMGAVYRATQTALNRQVAIKVLPENLCNNPKFVARLNREALVLAKISHANVVGCIDMGEHKGLRYVVMEFIEGESLGGLIEKRKHLPVQESLFYLKQAVVGLDHAHALGIIHRDIKPDNMLLSKHAQLGTTVRMAAGYQLKIADLGLASFSGESTENTRLTHEGAAIGSPHYMSPEQTLGQADIDFRTDIYALGITLYHMLTGKTPYSAPSVAAVLAQKLSQTIKDPRETRPELPGSISLLIQKMTAREKADRYASYGELLEDIEAIEQNRALKAEILKPPRASVELREDTIASLRRVGQRSASIPTRTGSGADTPRSNKGVLVLAGIGAVVVLGLAFVMMKKSNSTAVATPSTAPVPAPEKNDPPVAVKSDPPKTDTPKVNFGTLPLIEDRSTKGWAFNDTGSFGFENSALFIQVLGNKWGIAERALPSDEFTLRASLQIARGADNCEIRLGKGSEYVALGIRLPQDAPLTAYLERRKSANDEVIEKVSEQAGLSVDDAQDIRIRFWDGVASCYLNGKLFGTPDVDAAGKTSRNVYLAVRGGAGMFRSLEATAREGK